MKVTTLLKNTVALAATAVALVTVFTPTQARAADPVWTPVFHWSGLISNTTAITLTSNTASALMTRPSYGDVKGDRPLSIEIQQVATNSATTVSRFWFGTSISGTNWQTTTPMIIGSTLNGTTMVNTPTNFTAAQLSYSRYTGLLIVSNPHNAYVWYNIVGGYWDAAGNH